MNKLPAKITAIHQSGTILLVDADVDGQGFSALMIEASDRPEWLTTGNLVDLVFKETEVTLAGNLSGKISTRNRLTCRVKNIHKGELLSKVELQFKQYTLISAVTSRAVEALEIVEGSEVEALIKANEVSLMKTVSSQYA